MTRRGFLFASAACAWGQSVETQSEIRGKKIVADAIAALGGDSFLTMADRTESGRAYSYYHDQISGLSVAKIYTRYLTVDPSKSGEALGQIEKEVYGKTEDTVGSVSRKRRLGHQLARQQADGAGAFRPLS